MQRFSKKITITAYSYSGCDSCSFELNCVVLCDIIKKNAKLVTKIFMPDTYIKEIKGKIVLETSTPRQPKLSIDEQLQHLINDHGITFNLKGENAAKTFLSSNNYYHKLKAYSKNFSVYNNPKHEKYGKFCDLDFEYLVELSTLDMYLRKHIMEITLNIEHFLKVQLIYDITNNKDEDAYNIVDKFTSSISEDKRREISNKLKNYYYERYNKHSLLETPAWEIVEALSFGDFIMFYELYYTLYPNNDNLKNSLKPVQWLRNAAAHNNCIINDLNSPSDSNFEINKKITKFISEIEGISESARAKKLANRSMHDFVVMLYVFNTIVKSEKVRAHTMNSLKRFIDERMVLHKDYFVKNALLQSNYIFLKKVVDYCVANVL